MLLISALKNFGFTQQEAVLYIELCKHGELTGYEAAKVSGISRSNAYAALSSLTDKGYAHMIEGTAVKYIAVSKEELLANVERTFNENISVIERELVFNQISQEPYITISGENNILNKLKNLIRSSQKRIYLSCPDELLSFLCEPLSDIVRKGLKVVILSPQDTLIEAPHMHYATEANGSFKMLVDTEIVLAGTMKQSLYSKNPTLVSLIRESFINEIAVIEAKTTTNSM